MKTIKNVDFLTKIMDRYTLYICNMYVYSSFELPYQRQLYFIHNWWPGMHGTTDNKLAYISLPFPHLYIYYIVYKKNLLSIQGVFKKASVKSIYRKVFEKYYNKKILRVFLSIHSHLFKKLEISRLCRNMVWK